jgi:hypothetical protein
MFPRSHLEDHPFILPIVPPCPCRFPIPLEGYLPSYDRSPSEARSSLSKYRTACSRLSHLPCLENHSHALLALVQGLQLLFSSPFSARIVRRWELLDRDRHIFTKEYAGLSRPSPSFLFIRYNFVDLSSTSLSLFRWSSSCFFEGSYGCGGTNVVSGVVHIVTIGIAGDPELPRCIEVGDVESFEGGCRA